MIARAAIKADKNEEDYHRGNGTDGRFTDCR